MPKPDEFEVHTMGGGASGGNASPSSSSDLGASQNISAGAKPSSFQPQTMQSPGGSATSSQPSKSPLEGMGQGGPSKPFTGAPSSPVSSKPTGMPSMGTMNTMSDAKSQVFSGGMGDDELSGASSNKMLKIFVGVFVTILLIGGAVFGVFFFMDRNSDVDLVEGETVENESLISTTTEEETTPAEDVEPVEPEEQTAKVRYSDELLNYLAIDTESETILSDIQSELDIIRLNLPSNNFSEPITFIVTNKQNKPISFSDFTVYSDMGIPSDILLALDDRFEIYAYNDFSAGVRFGFRVDVKNAETLKTALDANASSIPPASLIFFKNFVLDSTRDMTFHDGSYKDYAVKYLNLDEGNTRSIDYVVDEDRWVLGTSQKTLRAIIDKLDKVSSESSSSESSSTSSTTTTTTSSSQLGGPASEMTSTTEETTE